MAIMQSVGRDGENRRNDVRVVQLLLNLNLGRLGGAAPGAPVPQPGTARAVAAPGGTVAAAPAVAAVGAYAPPPPGAPVPLVADGDCGPRTIARIELAQRLLAGAGSPSGRVGTGDPLLATLREAVPPGLSAEALQLMMPNAAPRHVERYRAALDEAMRAYGIATPLRQAHFLAQIGHESCDLVHSEEIASGAAYENRRDLGNTRPGDGVRFKGRGLIQITGRANYAAYGAYRRRDYLTGDGPTLLATDPATAVDSACWYWTRARDINPKADADDVLAVSKMINGVNRRTGLPNGFGDRQERTARAKFVLRVS